MAKLLIVDDEAMMQDLAKPFFERRAYQVLYTSKGEEGLQIFKKENPDVVLLDMGLPDIDGKDVLVQMKQINKNSKIIVMTGFGEDEIKKKIVPLGPDAYFTKPCRLPAVDEKIKELLK
jgi:two-component system response regulator (stage 0 sporulation protein F)